MDTSRFLKSPLVHFLLIAAVSLICYSNTFNVPFQFDDSHYIVKNPLVKDFDYFLNPSKANDLLLTIDIKRYFTTRYVGYLSLWGNYKLGGLNVRGYHIANLAIHLVNAALVYLLVRLTLRTPLLQGSRLRERTGAVSLFCGLLFAVHPIQTEAVTYILQRFVLLSAMFYLLCIAAYVGSRLSEKKGRRCGLYVLAVVSAVLGMKTKEIAFTLPLVIALYEFLFFKGGLKKRTLYLVPLLLTMLIIPLTYIFAQSNSAGFGATLQGATSPGNALPRLDYLFTQFSVLATYLRLLALPVGQNLDHDYPVFHSFFDPSVFLSFLFLLGIFGLGIYLYYRSRITDRALRLAAFGIFWFFMTISVESSVLPLSEMAVEYRVYLPSVGFITATVVLIFFLFDSLQRQRPPAGKTLISMLVLAALVLAGTSYARNNIWATELSLWEDVVKKSPQKPRAHHNVALAHQNRGQVDKAIEHYEAALRLAPDNKLAHNNLGLIYKFMGLYDKAIEHYETALVMDPATPLFYNNLGDVYRLKGQADKAIEHYEAALRLKPNYTEVHFKLGAIYKSRGLPDKAIEHYEAALRLMPDLAQAHNNLGIIYRSMGLMDKAIEHLKKALESDPDNAMVHLNLSAAYQSKGMAKKAAEHFRMANR